MRAASEKLKLALCLAAAVLATDAFPGEAIDDLLLRLDQTATLYSQTALSFSCEEAIRWEGRNDDGHRKFSYVVVIDDEGRFEDYRTLVRKRKKSNPPERVEPLDYGVPSYLRSAWLWVFVFKEDRWPYHRYAIVGEEKLSGRPAIQVSFEPILPYRTGINEWFGTAWVDGETAQLLKVEAHRAEDEEQLRKVAQHAEGEAVSDWVYVVEEVTTEFSIEERGLRFPGRVELRNDSYDFMRGLKGFNRATRTIMRVRQIYSDYRFYDVETTPVLEPTAR